MKAKTIFILSVLSLCTSTFANDSIQWHEVDIFNRWESQEGKFYDYHYILNRSRSGIIYTPNIHITQSNRGHRVTFTCLTEERQELKGSKWKKLSKVNINPQAKVDISYVNNNQPTRISFYIKYNQRNQSNELWEQDWLLGILTNQEVGCEKSGIGRCCYGSFTPYTLYEYTSNSFEKANVLDRYEIYDHREEFIDAGKYEFVHFHNSEILTDKLKITIEYDAKGKCLIYSTLQSNNIGTCLSLDNVVSLDGLCLTLDIEKSSWGLFKLDLSNFIIEQTNVAYDINPQYWEIAQNLYKQERYKSAQTHINKLIDEYDYKSYESYLLHAKVDLALKDSLMAMDYLDKAISFPAENKEEAYYLRGELKLQQNDMSGKEDLKRAGEEGMKLLQQKFPAEFAPKPEKPTTKPNPSPTPKPTPVQPTPQPTTEDEESWLGSASGFFLSRQGYIATNYHVVAETNKIQVEYYHNGKKHTYAAKIVIVDPANDLAIIRINNTKFSGIKPIPYKLSLSAKDVGSEVFTLGYPLSSIMGEEIKYTRGEISAKTGILGDVRTYQISVPITNGNSGGPLFDSKGNIIGITSSGLRKDLADNVNYAIKSTYLQTLVESSQENIVLPSGQDLTGKTKPELIKILQEFVVLIKVK